MRMATLDKAKAKARIKKVLAKYKSLTPSDEASLDVMNGGKVYELYVLSRLVAELRHRGFSLRLVGSDIRFKAAPGLISANDPHFEVFAPGTAGPVFKIFMDIEFRTLGAGQSGATSKCSYHEIDIVVVTPLATGRPAYTDIALGIECKAHENFTKGIVKQALGIRRELSLLAQPALSTLSAYQIGRHVRVPADPPSEFWLAYIDPKGSQYQTSPAVFGIQFKHWQP